MAKQQKLSHLDQAGRVRMVDIGSKPVTERRAVAEGCVRISAELADAIRDCALPKGNLLEIARIAGIQAAKHTSTLLPLCHPLLLDVVQVDIALVELTVRVVATVRTTGKTGAEMEALTAVAVAALTVVDMGKAIDRGMVVERIRLLEKSGGRHGDYVAPQSIDASEGR